MSAPRTPDARPAEGWTIGGLVFAGVAAGVWAVLLATYTHWWDSPWNWAAGSLSWIVWQIDRLLNSLHLRAHIPLVRPTPAPPSDWSPALRWAIAWRDSIALAAGLFAGIHCGIRAGAAPPAERYVSGRRLVRSPKQYARTIRQREAADGLRIHPKIPLSKNRESQHFLLLGLSGSGKTQVVHRLIRNARARGDQSLVYDYKGDLTAKYLDDATTVLLAPWDARSVAWDIAADVPDIASARELAAALIPLPQTGDSKWAAGARQVLTGLIVALQTTQPGQWSIHDLSRTVSADGKALAATLRQYFPEAEPLLADPTRNPGLSYIASLLDHLAPVHDLARLWSTDDNARWSVRRWLDGGEAPRVIVGHNEGQAELSGFMLRAVLRLILQRLGSPDFQRAPVPTWLFLDEFIQAGEIEPLLSIAEIARSKDVRAVLACQTISRLREIYGQNTADALVDTIGTVLVGRSSGATAQWASGEAGDQRLDRFQASTSKTGGSTSWQRVKEPTMPPEEFDARLGTFGRGRYLTNRLLMLAGGDEIGLIDWPLLRVPTVTQAYVPASTATQAASPPPATDDRPAAMHDSTEPGQQADDTAQSRVARLRALRDAQTDSTGATEAE